MRNLETRDLFEAGRLISKIGIREEILEIAKRAEENAGKKIKIDFGVDLILGIFEKAMHQNTEKEIYVFIANIFECTWEDVQHMDPLDLFDKLEQVADFEKWKSFFKRAVRLIPKK